MNEHRLLTPERESRIIELLQHQNVLTVAELSQALEVSAATVRRDLQSMHERKILTRVRGGATLRRLARVEPVFQDKETRNRDAKQKIAEIALSLIEDHDRIYLDGGSTALILARLLNGRRDLTVVTNSLMAAEELMTSDHRLILVGGEFRALSRTLVGPLTSSIINSLHVDKAFMGTIGFTLEEGMTTTEPSEAYTKECIMRRSDQVVLLVDSSKLGTPSFARSGNLEDIDIVVTDSMAPQFQFELEARGLKVLQPGANQE